MGLRQPGDCGICVLANAQEGDTSRKHSSRSMESSCPDFYAAYDAMDCPQQKCLIHLIRDLNDNLLKPLSMRNSAAGRAIRRPDPGGGRRPSTGYGLKRCHLHKHKRDVDRFSRWSRGHLRLGDRAALPAAVPEVRGQAVHVPGPRRSPWNNNNAENAVKRLVSRRKVLGGNGGLQRGGFRDYFCCSAFTRR